MSVQVFGLRDEKEHREKREKREKRERHFLSTS
jgi:hypothetical protein